MGRLRIAAITLALAGGAFAMPWFGSGEVLEKIERKAVAERNWPSAARAVITRANVEKGIRDEAAKDWLPAFAARIDAAPAELQGVLQLHLAHVYRDESRPWRWGGRRPTKLSDTAATNQPPWAPERLN